MADFYALSIRAYNYNSATDTYTAQGGPNITSVTITDDDAGDNEFTVGEYMEAFGTIFDYQGFLNIGGEIMMLELYAGQFYVYSPLPNTTSGQPASFTGSDIQTTPLVECFAAGTKIATPAGSCAVEALQVGDTILKACGGETQVLWVGHQTVPAFSAFAGRRLVRIRAGALGGGLPESDLTVTADHGMVLEGYVINASVLVNGDTIDFVPVSEIGDSFTVYHIETEDHDVILANGAASETFVDAVTRSHFDNYGAYLDLYGAQRIIPEMTLPRISSTRLLPKALGVRLRPGQASNRSRPIDVAM